MTQLFKTLLRLLILIVGLILIGCGSDTHTNDRVTTQHNNLRNNKQQLHRQNNGNNGNKNDGKRDTSNTKNATTQVKRDSTTVNRTVNSNNVTSVTIPNVSNGVTSTTQTTLQQSTTFTYTCEYKKEVQEILEMMLEIALLDLKDKLNIADMATASKMFSKSYKDAYSIISTKPRLLQQMDNVIRDRNRALAQQLYIDYNAYEADSNLVDIVKFKEIKVKSKKN